jgi:hypothetical protein
MLQKSITASPSVADLRAVVQTPRVSLKSEYPISYQPRIADMLTLLWGAFAAIHMKERIQGWNWRMQSCNLTSRVVSWKNPQHAVSGD